MSDVLTLRDVGRPVVVVTSMRDVEPHVHVLYDAELRHFFLGHVVHSVKLLHEPLFPQAVLDCHVQCFADAMGEF